MDFFNRLPQTQRGHDAIWVIVDRLMNYAHIFPMKMTDSIRKLSKVYIEENMRLNGVSLSILSDQDQQFTYKFWLGLQLGLGIHFHVSTAYHPQIDKYYVRTIQTLEDMLRACVMDWEGSQKEHLLLIEFVYNNSYQVNIQMALYQALYSRPCRSALYWMEVGESRVIRKVTDIETGEVVVLGLEMLQETTEKIALIQGNIQVAQSRQSKYAEKHRISLEFKVGNLVFLIVTSRRGLQKAGKLGKLAP